MLTAFSLTKTIYFGICLNKNHLQQFSRWPWTPPKYDKLPIVEFSDPNPNLPISQSSKFLCKSELDNPQKIPSPHPVSTFRPVTGQAEPSASAFAGHAQGVHQAPQLGDPQQPKLGALQADGAPGHAAASWVTSGGSPAVGPPRPWRKSWGSGWWMMVNDRNRMVP